MENNHTKKDINNKVTLILLIGILLSAILIIPFLSVKYYDDLIRGMAVSGFLTLFASFQIFNNKTSLKFSWTDAFWLGLITLTGLSALWATNTFYVYFGTITTLVLYLCFKAFEIVEWDRRAKRFVSNVLVLCCLLSLGTLSYYVFFEPKALYNGSNIVKVFGVNLNFVGSSIVILFPFLLFRRSKIMDMLNPIFFLMSFYILYQIGSAQVVLALIILGIIYLVYRINISTKILVYLVLGSIIIGSLSIGFIYSQKDKLHGKSFVIDEFKYQNDRFQMWENSFLLFSKSPIIGIGKNNWPIEVYQFGYDNYARGIKKPYKPNYYKHAHNSFFQTLSELGVLGIIVYGGIIFFSVKYIVKKNKDLKDLEFACASSLIIFFFLSLMYGVVYNHFINFKGIPIIAVFTLAFLGKSIPPKINIKSGYFYSFFILLSIGSFFFFYKCYIARSYYIEAPNFVRQKKYSEAENLYFEALKGWDKGQVYEALGNLYEKNQSKDDAISNYKLALKINPYRPQNSYNYATLLFQKGNYQEALRQSQKAHELFKGYIPNQLLLAKCYLKTDNNEKASIIAENLKIDLELRMEKSSLLKKHQNKIKKPISPRATRSERELRNSYKVLNQILKEIAVH